MIYLLFVIGGCLSAFESTRVFSIFFFLAAVSRIVYIFVCGNIKRKKDLKEAEKVISENPTWDKVKKAVFTIKGMHCSSCGSSYRLDIHHKKPISIGGDNSIENLEVLCRSCHESKHGRQFDERNKDEVFVDYENEFKYETDHEYGRKPPRKTPKVKIISNAIAQQKDISFNYVQGNEYSPPKVVSG